MSTTNMADPTRIKPLFQIFSGLMGTNLSDGLGASRCSKSRASHPTKEMDRRQIYRFGHLFVGEDTVVLHDQKAHQPPSTRSGLS